MREEDKQHTAARESQSRASKLRNAMKKSWVWPAVYLSACAILLGSFFFIQGTGNDQAEEPLPPDDLEWGEESQNEEDAVEVALETENLQMPVTDEDSVEIIGYYYDHEASTEEQQAALVYYNNMYYHNKGIDVAREDNETFEVTAAASGEVVKAEKDSLLGHIVELEHEDGLVTSYNSLEKLEVEEGDSVSQGDVLGMAGRNLYNTDAGVHAHFEVRSNGEALNPVDMLHQPMSEIVNADEKEEEPKEEPKEETDTEDQGDEDLEEMLPQEDDTQDEEEEQPEENEEDVE
ncbi:peptidoglycan DD-metalloendopeptidase family protein [Thalassorhabdus alkalitolerans]|uniref:Peptidoglycan DD-metalloendopeptidase family protein n=1 Tax=Thalassorhabdus alkalitolerans TaxID=2282697 RepID=A0ABW0YGF0_9BACI